MKTRPMIVMAAVAIALIALPTFAQDAAESGRRACNPEGTWFGSNSEGLSFIFTITRVGGGRYMAVSDGLTNLAYCASASGWRGEMVRTGLNTYELRQIELCDAYGILTLWAISGEVALTDCGHFEAEFDNLGVYFWGTGFTPFVDPYDIPIVPPGPPITASYDRMAAP